MRSETEVLYNSWVKSFGGSNNEYEGTIRQTMDGGFIVVGYTSSFSATIFDVWVLKLGQIGNIEWQKKYGDSGDDRATFVEQISNGSYLIAGYSSSYGTGGMDATVLVLDSAGNVQFQAIYGDGASGNDTIRSLHQTTDCGYIAAG